MLIEWKIKWINIKKLELRFISNDWYDIDDCTKANEFVSLSIIRQTFSTLSERFYHTMTFAYSNADHYRNSCSNMTEQFKLR